jgi:hypothetical protein
MTSLKSLINSIKTRNLYSAMLIFYVVDSLNHMVIVELIRKELIDIPLLAFGLFQFLVILLGNAIALIIVRRFVINNKLFFIFVTTIILSIIFLFMTESPAGENFSPDDIRSLRLWGIGFQLFSLNVILTVAIKDVFREKHDLFYCLTGATTIFLMIGTIFGIFYAFLEVWSPGMLFEERSAMILSRCLTYSFSVIAGQDPGIEHVDVVIKNLSIFESLFSNLYSIMVVGRLLSK